MEIGDQEDVKEEGRGGAVVTLFLNILRRPAGNVSNPAVQVDGKPLVMGRGIVGERDATGRKVMSWTSYSFTYLGSAVGWFRRHVVAGPGLGEEWCIVALGRPPSAGRG